MDLYEEEGAAAAIERSRKALATGQMRLSLAGAEMLGCCGVWGCVGLGWVGWLEEWKVGWVVSWVVS